MANRSRLNENGDLVIQKMVFGKWCDVVYNDTENKRRRNKQKKDIENKFYGFAAWDKYCEANSERYKQFVTDSFGKFFLTTDPHSNDIRGTIKLTSLIGMVPNMTTYAIRNVYRLEYDLPSNSFNKNIRTINDQLFNTAHSILYGKWIELSEEDYRNLVSMFIAEEWLSIYDYANDKGLIEKVKQ